MRIKDTLHALTVNLYSPTVQLQVNFPQIYLLCHSESLGPVHTGVLRNLSLRSKHLSFQVDSRMKTFSCSSAFLAVSLSPSLTFRSHRNPLKLALSQSTNHLWEAFSKSPHCSGPVLKGLNQMFSMGANFHYCGQCIDHCSQFASCSTLSRMAVTAHVKGKGEGQKEIILWVEATMVRAIINKSKAEGTPWAWGSDTGPHLK